MTPVIPLADPLPQPAPPLLLWALLQLTFLLHLVAMNVVLGGSVLALHWRFSRRAEDAPHRACLLAFFERALPVAVAAAVTLGVAPLLFVQVLYGRLFFTSSILMAWFWLAVVPLVIVAYYGAYLLAFRGEALRSRARAVAALVAGLFATVAFLYVSNVTRALRPDTFAEAYRADRRGLLLNLGDPTFWPRYLHVVLGAVAVAALGVALYGVLRRAHDPGLGAWAIRRGTTVFGVATTTNIFVGLLFLLSQPRPVLIRLVGGDAWAMTLLALGILLGRGGPRSSPSAKRHARDVGAGLAAAATPSSWSCATRSGCPHPKRGSSTRPAWRRSGGRWPSSSSFSWQARRRSAGWRGRSPAARRRRVGSPSTDPSTFSTTWSRMGDAAIGRRESFRTPSR
jgi:hypothetical protein